MVARSQVVRISSSVLSTSVFAAVLFLPIPGMAQSSAKSSSDSAPAPQKVSADTSERWLHVRVNNSNSKDETVRVNVPLELAEKVLPTIDHDRLHSGKIKIDDVDSHGVDIRTLLDAIRSSKDGEFVTIQDKDSDIRVAKQNAYIYVHVLDKNGSKKSRVEVKVPLKVVDALLSGAKDELDISAGLRALSAQGDTELVSVKDNESTVRVWLDSKNLSD
jgi:hypothetical protein